MIDTIHLQPLLATFAAWANRRQTSVIAHLIEENRVLKEQLESSGRGACASPMISVVGWLRRAGRSG